VLSGLQQIRSAMQEIASGGGDLTRRLEVRSQDKVGQTAEAFNRFLAGSKDTRSTAKGMDRIREASPRSPAPWWWSRRSRSRPTCFR